METLGFKAEINGIEGVITNLKDYKAALKAATDAQVTAGLKFGENSEQFKKASGNVDHLRSKMDSLNQTFKNTSSGSGIDKVNNSLATFKEGLASADPAKLKAGIQGLGAAMKAIPLILIIDGIRYIVENFDSLSKGSGVLAQALQWVGKVIDGVTDGLKYFSDAILNTSYQFEAAAEKMAAASKLASDKTIEGYEMQLKFARDSGKETIDLEKKVLVAKREGAFEQILILESIKQKTGELSEEQLKQLDEYKKAYLTAKSDLVGVDTKAAKEKEALDKKAAEDAKAKHDKEIADYKEKEAKLSELKIAGAQIDKDNRKLIADDIKAEKDKALADQMAIDQAEYDNMVALAEKKKKDDEQAVKDHAVIEQAKQDITTNAINAGANLAELVGQIALNRAKGNANKELQIRKTMFNVDKAFNVARAVQDGIRSVQAALTIPPPFGQILAGINGAAAAVNVGKILATKFDGGSVGSIDTGTTGGGNAPNIGGNINTSVPNVAPQPQQSTQFDENGKRITIKAELVETESRKVTERIDKFNKQREY